MPGKKINDVVQNIVVSQGFATIVAIKHDARNAPCALARDAPVRTRGDHVRDALLTPGRHPLDTFDRIERLLAEVVAFHADEPLLGGTEDGRVVTAPAVWIAMVD